MQDHQHNIWLRSDGSAYFNGRYSDRAIGTYVNGDLLIAIGTADQAAWVCAAINETVVGDELTFADLLAA